MMSPNYGDLTDDEKICTSFSARFVYNRQNSKNFYEALPRPMYECFIETLFNLSLDFSYLIMLCQSLQNYDIIPEMRI